MVNVMIESVNERIENCKLEMNKLITESASTGYSNAISFKRPGWLVVTSCEIELIEKEFKNLNKQIKLLMLLGWACF